MSHIFISHSSQNDSFVTTLAEHLRAVGVNTWVDHRDILPGSNWDREVEKALKTCDPQRSLSAVNCLLKTV